MFSNVISVKITRIGDEKWLKLKSWWLQNHENGWHFKAIDGIQVLFRTLITFTCYGGGGGGVTRRGRLPGLPNQVTNSPGLNFAMQKFQRGVTQR